jgi:transcriptional regulator GlxA family with amidase domain
LRVVATLGDQSHRTAKAIAWVTANYAKPLLVEELAQLASMGVSTLHHHFRMLASMSPLQYQKQLRLPISAEPDAEEFAVFAIELCGTLAADFKSRAGGTL